MNIRLFSIITASILSMPLFTTAATAKFTPDKLALTSNEVTCSPGITTYARAETKGYYINICGDANGPNRYVGAGKSGQAIVLPLKSYSDGTYTAVSGNIRYTLNSSYLTVTQSGRTILKQKIINWR